MTVLLAIESSCDETSVALLNSSGHQIACLTRNQLEMHAKHGGVIPEVAARDHLAVLSSLVQQLFRETGVSADDVGAVAVTQGPGLVGALLVGIEYARSFAAFRSIPVYGVNHLEGHVLAALLEQEVRTPALAAVVSGGHTQLVFIEELGQYDVRASTVDDAVGEAFDKVARLLELPYPGGPEVMRLARGGTPGNVQLPRPLLHSGDGRMSMSGLKTAVIEVIKKLGPEQMDQYAADLAAEFHAAVGDVLCKKVEYCYQKSVFESLIFTGGVAANTILRDRLADWCKAQSVQFVAPSFEFCTDNAAMIGRAAYSRWQSGADSEAIEPKSRWSLGSD